MKSRYTLVTEPDYIYNIQSNPHTSNPLDIPYQSKVLGKLRHVENLAFSSTAAVTTFNAASVEFGFQAHIDSSNRKQLTSVIRPQLFVVQFIYGVDQNYA